ncbi:MAG TPA: septum formation initiator family protein [Gemmatimonadaceae bacterium]|nr:septum formation initiator family protein [Gemmatimonadaceae bacterium]
MPWTTARTEPSTSPRPRARKKKGSPVKKRIGRVVLFALGAAVLYYAVEGGEYGTSDIIRQRAERNRLQNTIDSLRRDVDSLTRVEKAVRTDPAVQEQIAREEFGMVRGDKEILYRFAEPEDSTGR